jgi:hypothetical protein
MSGKQRRRKRLVAQDRWLHEFGTSYAHPLVIEHDPRIPEDQRTEHNPRVPEDYREPFALALLGRALVLINKHATFRPISALGLPDDPLLQFDYLISVFEQQLRPGQRPRRKRRQPVGKTGAPRLLTVSPIIQGERDLQQLV